MIQDVLEMPFAITKKDITFKNLIPTIVYDGHHCNENWYWTGREIELSKLRVKETYRYKIIEYSGDYVIERVVLTDKPIDVNSDWSKCTDTNVFPIYAIARPINGKGYPRFDRYLPGIFNSLYWFDNCPGDLQTIHSAIDRRLNDWYHPNTRIARLIDNDIHRFISSGSMYDNFDQYAMILHATDINAWCSEEDIVKLNNHPEEFTHKFEKMNQNDKVYASFDLKLSNLNFLKNSSSGLWCINQTTGKPNRLFDPNDEDVEHNTIEYKTLYQMQLIEYFTKCKYTDIYLKAKVRKNIPQGVRVRRKLSTYSQFDVLNRYTGTHRDRSNMILPDDMEETTRIYELIEEAFGDIISEMEILKNWWDEIYIRFTDHKGIEHKYFYDLTWLALADCTLVETID